MIIYSKETRGHVRCHCKKKKHIRKETPRWAAVIPGKIFERKKQPYKASMDLWLAVLRGPMQSIIDLAAIIQLPAWNKENFYSQRNSPTLPAQYEKITSLNQLNEKKKGEGGKEWRLFQRIFRRKQLFSCPAFSTTLVLSGQQQNEQIAEKQTVKSYSFIFSVPWAAVLCLKMEGFECVCLCVCGGCSIFLILT